MKKPIYFLLLVGLLAFVQPLTAQDSTEVRTPNSVAAKVLFIDYGVPNGFDDLTTTNGMEINYSRRLNDYANFSVPLKVGVADIRGFIDKRTIVSLDAIVQIPIFRKAQQIRPYLFGGGGFTVENFESSNIQFPFGLGTNIFLGGSSFINFQVEFRKATQEKRDNLQFGLGYLFNIVKKGAEVEEKDRDGDGIKDSADKCPDVAGHITASGCPDQDGDGISDANDGCPEEPGNVLTNGCPDRDGDGVADVLDECPDQAGLAMLKGCPNLDSDGDGIADVNDACPEIFGPKDTQGCPDKDGDGVTDKIDLCPETKGEKNTSGCPDRDQDGIADNFDSCPDLAGPPERKGCPIMDDDGDGVPNEQDNCPNTAGPANNNGCPELEQEVHDVLLLAASNVQFETGESELLSSSYEILDEIVSILKRYPDYKLRIGGHTDRIGHKADNLVLSTKRARRCNDYFIAQGIDSRRLSFNGYGELKPITTNKTPEGRALNRRVEFDLYLPE